MEQARPTHPLPSRLSNRLERTTQPAIHEDFSRSHSSGGSTDRSFGFVFAAFFMILALWPLLRGRTLQPWALGVSTVFAVIALLQPALLRPLNRLWFRIGILLSKITNPIVMALIFYVLFTPAALLSRLFERDPLRIRIDPDAQSYWIPREPAEPSADSMRRQY